jgi:hypothetical protein
MNVHYGFLYLILTGPELTVVLCSMFMKTSRNLHNVVLLF